METWIESILDLHTTFICNLDWKISQQCLQSGIWRLTSNKSGCYIVRINLGHRTLLSSICASLCLVINTFLVNLTSLFYLKQIWTLLYSRILMNAATHTSYLICLLWACIHCTFEQSWNFWLVTVFVFSKHTISVQCASKHWHILIDMLQ